MSIINTVLFISFIAFLIWYYFKLKFSYWKNLGVPYIEPRFPYGNIQGRKRKFHSSQLLRKFYEELKVQGKFGGIYFFTKPVLFITDLDFLKTVLIKDFQYFHDRGAYYNEEHDPLSAHLVNIEGDKWKKLREKISPTFSSGKMKNMLPTIVEVGKRLEKFMDMKIEREQELEIKEILARFTTDIIGTCAFGIECNSLEDSKAKFLEMGLKVFEQPRNSFLKQIIAVTYPEIAKKLKIKTTRDDVTEFFMNIVKDVVEYRETNKIKRNDFMDLLLQLKNDGTSEGKLSIEQIAAQVFVFFLGGFETSSTTMTFTLHELSQNPDIQEKVRSHIEEVLARHDGEITYEALNEMHFLEQCINEALRKFPPAGSLIRSVTKDYQVPDSNIILKKGTTVFMSIYGIHHDPQIYENPEKYDPDRFLPVNIKKRHPMAFIPFGQGPRICIGERFGYLETKVGLVTLLSKFRFKPSDKTKVPIAFSKKNIILSPEGGMFLQVEKL